MTTFSESKPKPSQPLSLPPPTQPQRPNPSITAISWTGGKDCNLSLLHAHRDPSLDVRYLVVFRVNEKSFLAHPIPFMEAQAKSLGLELLFVDIPQDTNDYMQAYIDGIVNLKVGYGIEVITTGDMDLVGTMERNWMERCCEGASIRVHLPLWKKNREDVLEELLDEGFRIMFSCVKSPFFDGSWIGRMLDRNALEEMKVIADRKLTEDEKESGVKELDLCGERGEYHTMCVDGPLYRWEVMLEREERAKEIVMESKWEGNIHNAKKIWTICLKESGETKEENGG
eukprot:CAMPEP_0171426912 /NCGR_PEP_ID=MMETSP0881-20121228/4282_1 /TAXON_ID=67004 /ORGANISM="Thalassiosira weissflogii, Strain CCMP1336" /LENGTH=284 /DNA_ID=CAMNT_0011946497 /DNA_START=11 /DNA_END=865 /DNA_ORIENTATION=-